jgi:hypothetical protein
MGARREASGTGVVGLGLGAASAAASSPVFFSI